MTKKSQEKLADYLEGFGALGYDGITPVGAVLTSAKNQKDILTELKKGGFGEIKDNELEHKLPGVEDKLKTGEKFFVNFSSQVLPKVFNFFIDMTRGKIPGSKVLFVMPAKLYDSHANFDRLISSVCRL